jgi:thiamine biosynthesis lipoprotein
MTFKQVITAVIVVAVIALVVTLNIAYQAPPLTLKRDLFGVMGTSCCVVAQAPADQDPIAEAAINAAQDALARVESMMSRYGSTGLLVRINAADAGEATMVSPELMDVLLAARQAAIDTDGAFDVTVLPLISLWDDVEDAAELPTPDAISEVMSHCGWSHITLQTDTEPGQVIKDDPAVRIDLGGIAKGYGIDQAMAAMEEAGAQAGLVNVGGDIGVFGQCPTSDHWPIDIRSPFEEGQYIGTVEIDSGVVCTSGNYERFWMIDGARYSHILDPRTGMSADASPSVTVWAPTGMQADLWATALSVLGEPGLAMLPDGVEAMLVIGTPEAFELVMTPGIEPHFTPATQEGN